MSHDELKQVRQCRHVYMHQTMLLTQALGTLCHPHQCMPCISISSTVYGVIGLPHWPRVEQLLGQDVTVKQLSGLALVGPTAAADLFPRESEAHQLCRLYQDQLTGESQKRDCIAP